MKSLPPVGVNAFVDPELERLEKVVFTMKFGDWIPEQVIGKGSYGLAVAAHKQITLGEFSTSIPGVIKIMLPRAGVENSMKMLTKEINNLSKMNSRFVTKLLDAGFSSTKAGETIPYFVMDYVEGPNLFEIIKMESKRTLTGLGPALFKTMASHTLRALASAHKYNIHHLDIKPNNILYSVEDDAFVLIDFGIAVISNREVVNQYVGGTPGYMAPETFEEITTKKADIYSLGMTFYHAITGVNPIWQELARWEVENGPFKPGQIRVLQQITQNTQISFDDLLPDQRALIEPMLSSDPKTRPSLAKLIDKTNRLEVPTETKLTKRQNDFLELESTWQSAFEEVQRKILKTGVKAFKLEIDESVHYHVWFKVKEISGKLVVVCSRIRDTSGFSDLGWVRHEQGLMLKVLEHMDADHLAETIIQAMRFGYKLTPPFELT